MSEAYHLWEWADKKQGPYVPALVSPLEMKDNAVFVDLGCGSGYVNSYVSSHCAPAENIGIDYEAATIELAKKLNAGNGGVKWMCASAESIPLPTASVDYIVCRGVVPLAHVDTVFAEISRILRPGGRVVFLLHSWTFYFKWLSTKSLKKDAIAVLHFLLGAWFNLTGHQVQLRWGSHVIGQTWQTEARVRKMLGRKGMSLYKVVSVPEFLVYAEKNGSPSKVRTSAMSSLASEQVVH